MKIPTVLSLLGLVLAMLVTGCKSTKPGGQSHAALEITGQSRDAIQAAAVVVFAEHGFQLRTTQSAQMVFDRPATTSEKLKYGDWMNDGMLMQIKLRLQDQPHDASLLRLDVYVVHDPHHTLFRSERRIMSFNRSSYRKMLEDIRDRLRFSPLN